MSTATFFTDLARTRHSPRQFLSTPLPPSDIRGVLEDAQTAPSNSNTQPWNVHVVSGAARDSLSRELLKAFEEDRTSLDFTADYGQGIHRDRSHEHAAIVYGTRGVARSDQEGRREVIRENLRFYGAPHVALLFMPVLGDGVRAAGDIGMYAQNFLLSLTARGYRGIPQAVLGVYADTVRQTLGISEDLKLLFGIAFGTGDQTSPMYGIDVGRVPLQHSVVLHDTPGVLGPA
ncbi:putative p-nitrobenzoate reductase [Streptomyces ambofaciens ATCC 23877]|uniref:Putative p-nitrobenzoate reductase n=1 Tax=Streptomyces ambofaciens (strain ATCC 23877 / 3486 / DSM 40053 / JCM 4204 / NBRC 12836 / NRRL B-2516) TaxID=278992 RepID=A0AC78_STRA7|nr:nitroreductase [Streptomyces ambofaciens]AKZ60272.1 putative p-nitrobenzoate reductase [Streptomyces ambofaciens ATCC 23877]CAJ88082.1 putative p-nitrobenzoate reductase [Streptomyces ambofaciens ATCC 23877]